MKRPALIYSPSEHAGNLFAAHLQMVLYRKCDRRSIQYNSLPVRKYLPTHIIVAYFVQFIGISGLICRKRRVNDLCINTFTRPIHNTALEKIHLLIHGLRHISRHSVIYSRESVNAHHSSGLLRCSLYAARSTKRHPVGFDLVVRHQFIFSTVEHHHRARGFAVFQFTPDKHGAGESHHTAIIESLRKYGRRLTAIANLPLRLLSRYSASRRSCKHKIIRINPEFITVIHNIERCTEEVLNRHLYGLVQQDCELSGTYTLDVFKPEPIVNGNHSESKSAHLSEPGAKPLLMP